MEIAVADQNILEGTKEYNLLRRYDARSSDNALAEKVVSIAPQATPTNRSGTITAGGTAQALMAANTAREGLWLQNQSAGDLWVSEVGTAAATQPSIRIPAGFYWRPPSVTAGAYSIFGATTGQAFAAREW